MINAFYVCSVELFEIFLARAKDRIKVFSEPDIDDSEEGKLLDSLHMVVQCRISV